MVVNQLFIHKPPIELLNKLIRAFGLNDINDTKEFTQLDMDINNTIATFHTLEKELGDCYIPCKRKEYTDNIKNIIYKEAITIFRQFLKAHNYDLYSKERFIKGIKYLVYKIVTKHEKSIISKTKKKQNHKKEFVIIFD
jgi:hypothetical protein